MMSGLVRCLIVDMEKKKFQFLEWERSRLSDGLGTYGIYLEELKYVWQKDPGAVALATGPLTGSAVPGSGAMSWCRMEQGRLLAEHTEGRLGAMLRYAGWEHMIITGMSSGRISLLVEDGRVSFLPAADREEQDVRCHLMKEQQDVDRVVSLMEADGIREDPYFLTGTAEMSEALLNKGLRAVLAVGRGGIEAEQPDGLLRESLELCTGFRESGGNAGGRKHPARFLSVNHVWEEGQPDRLPAMPLAFLGLGWDERFPGAGMKEKAARVLNCCTGGAWDEKKLQEISDRIERGTEGHDGGIL